MHSDQHLTAGPRPTTGLGATLTGTMLIAATYGMARFGVGLFAPRLALERPALADVVGLAAAAQFSSYALAAGAAARLSDRRPRAGLVLAGATASAGCLGIAVASTPAAFVAAVFVAGMGAGFASPAMVRVIDAVVAGRAVPTAQAMVNTGTAVGVIGAGLLTFATATTAPAWVLMALACAVSAGAVLLLVQGRSGFTGATTGPDSPAPDQRPWGRLVEPGVAALVVGAGSALIWTFGPLLATRTGPVPAASVGWLWIALGLGGLLGPLTGVVVDRLGPRRAWGLFAAALTVANVVLAAAVALGAGWLAFVALAVFGAGYMCLSGVLILWARSVWPAAAGAGTSVLFIALAVGQALGSAGFDPVRRQVGPILTLATAAALCAIGGGLTRRRASPSSALHRL